MATHLNLLFGSELARRFELAQFRVGSEGRRESRLGLLARIAVSPFLLVAAILRARAAIVHVNTSLNARAYWRDLAYVLAAKLCGARVVYQIHGGTLRDFYRPLSRVTLRWPDAVVVLSRREFDNVREAVGERNVALMPNAIDCTPFLRQPRAAARAGATCCQQVFGGRGTAPQCGSCADAMGEILDEAIASGERHLMAAE